MTFKQWVTSVKGEKLLLTDNKDNVNSLIKQINNEGFYISGLSVKTLSELAKELVIEEYSHNKEIKQIKIADTDTCALIIEGILRENSEKYSFVPRESICTATAAEILTNLNLIRSNIVTKSYITSEDEKVSQMNLLIEEYEKKLSEIGLLDNNMLIEAGIRAASSALYYVSKTHVASLFFDNLSDIEKRLVDSYSAKTETLSFDKTDKSNWYFFKSYGLWNEAEYILNDIKNRNIPFGQVSILYTSKEHEVSLLAAFERQNAPIRFLSGRSVSGSNIVRLLLSVINWAQNGYRYEDIKAVILNPAFYIPSEDENNFVNPTNEFLRGIDDGIGMGLDRYLSFIDRQKNLTDNNHFIHRNEYIEFLSDITKMFYCLPEPVDIFDLFDTLLVFADRYSRKNEENGIILSMLKKEHEKLRYVLPEDTLTSSISFISDFLKNLSLTESASPASVSASVLNGIKVLDRPYLYVIGLADRHYGIALIESPVLNDEERRQYLDLKHGNVKLSANKASDRLEAYLKSFELSNVTEIHAGYSYFDTIKQEELSPSSLYLTLLERFGGNSEGKSVEYQNVLDENTLVPYDSVWGTVTCPENTDEADESAVNEVTLEFSPSSLDSLLKCQVKYYYRKNRHIPEENYEITADGAWLQADKKGTFFHLMLQKYIEAVFIGKDIVSVDIDYSTFEKIFKEASEYMEELVPIESPASAALEKNEMHETAERYLSKMHREFSSPDCIWHVIACEKQFGKICGEEFLKEYQFDYDTSEPDNDTEDCDLDDSAVIHDVFHFSFSGIIDRIDGYTDPNGVQHYRIIDYKTSTKDSFVKYHFGGEKGKGIKTTQHGIYFMYLSQTGTVDEFEYHFPFEEDEDKQAIIVTELEDPFEADDESLLDRLHEIIFNRDYRYGKKECAFCSYSDICFKNIE